MRGRAVERAVVVRVKRRSGRNTEEAPELAAELANDVGENFKAEFVCVVYE